jgi:hypothetical protein
VRERKSAYRGLVEKPEGRRLRGRPSRREEENIKMEIRKVRRGGDMGSCESGNEPSGPMKYGEYLE